MKTEIWIPVLDYPNYEVSNLGRVRSKTGTRIDSIGRHYKVKGQILKPFTAGREHLLVTLRNDSGKYNRYVHILVLESFLPKPYPEAFALHWDDNPTNNNLSNLRWGDRSDNTKDSVRNGKHNQARKTQCPLGHPLEGKNLVPSQAKIGKRKCLACDRMKSYTSIHHRRYGTTFTEEEKRTLADNYYRGV